MNRQKDRDIIHWDLGCSGSLQIVRALLMSGMAVGVLAFILSLVGMECTYIGGKDKEKNRSVFTGGVCHITSGTFLQNTAEPL